MKQYTNRELRHHREIHKLEAEQLKLQAKEYERRLTDLNHAHAQAQQDKINFVDKLVYGAELRDLRGQLEKVRENADKATVVAADAAKDIATLQSTMTWLSRLIIAAIVAAVMGLILRPIVGI